MWSSTLNKNTATTAAAGGDGRAGSIKKEDHQGGGDENDSDDDDDNSKDKNFNRDEEEEEERLNLACNSGAATKKTWDEWYALLVLFKKLYHHTRVTKSKYRKLFNWVHSQRSAYSRQQRGITTKGITISPLHVQKLNEIGFEWSRTYRRRLPAAAAAAAAEDDDNEPQEEEQEQEQQELKDGSEENTGPIPVSGSAENASNSFDKYFELLVQFRKDKGHTTVPQKYPDNPKLGRWVSRMRYSFACKQQGKRSDCTITQSQINRLNQIDFVWACRQRRSGAAAAARKVNGIEEEEKKEEELEGGAAEEPMNEPRSTENSIDVAPGAAKSKRHKRDDSSSEFRLHRRRPAALDHGPLEKNNDVGGNLESEQGKYPSSRPLVPVHDLMADAASFHHDESNSNNEANDSTISVSTGTSMLDTVPRASYWNEMFECLVQHYEQHGHLEEKDMNPQLKEWIANQRKAYMRQRKGLKPNSSCCGIAPERIECLNRLGWFTWTDQQQAGGKLTNAASADEESPQRKRHHQHVEHESTSCAAGALELARPVLKPAQSFGSDAASMASNDPCNDQHSDTQQQEGTHQPPPPKKRQRNSLIVREKEAHESTKVPRRVSVALIGESQLYCEKQHERLTATSHPCDQQQQQEQQQEQSLSSRSRHNGFRDTQQQPPRSLVATEISPEKICFKDIVGHNSTKSRIDEILLALAPPQSMDNSIFIGLRSEPTSIFLYGPTGCGKTQLARAIAGEAKAVFLSIAPSDILGKPVGELETAIRSIFKQANERAAQLESKCAVLFFDHIDAFGSRENLGKEDACRSRRVLAELSIQLDNISQNQKPAGPHVLVVAATSCRPQDCDPALLRRFGARLHVGLPCDDDRKELLKRYLQDFDNDITQDDDDLLELTESLDGWSGADLKSLTREAAMAPVREHRREARLRGDQLQQTGGTLPKVRPVTLADFVEAYDVFNFVV